MSDQLTPQVPPADTPQTAPLPPLPADPAQDLTSVSQGMLGTPQPAQPVVGGPRRRELGSAPLPEAPVAQEIPQAPEVQPVPEVERSAEMGPELEKFVEQVEKQKKITAETVVAADTMPTQAPKTVSQPVVVLPLTEKVMKDGQSKGTSMSVRWLAEWCVRQIKKFRSMLVVYRENE